MRRSRIMWIHIQLHIPIYREGIRHEIDKFKISKNTDRNWLKAGYKLFLPILDVIKEKLLRINSILHIDETWTAVRIKLKGDGTKLGHYFKKYIWCLVNKAEGITYFFYDNDKNDSRGFRPIENFLGAFETGTIQSDAYVVYELLTNGWKDLIRYRDDGNYDIDNLVAERAIRPFTVHRNNAPSFGSDEGVQVACLFFTLCETCKNFCINFKEYVAYAAKELISGNTDYESLAPWAIKLV